MTNGGARSGVLSSSVSDQQPDTRTPEDLASGVRGLCRSPIIGEIVNIGAIRIGGHANARRVLDAGRWVETWRESGGIIVQLVQILARRAEARRCGAGLERALLGNARRSYARRAMDASKPGEES
jgi:hypothetical protein